MTAVRALHASWVVPVEPRGAVLDDHTVVIEDTHIAAVMPTAEWRASGRDADETTLAGHVLLPGLVNAHTHAPMSLFRGFADDLPLKPWLEEHVWPAESACVGREFVRDGTRLAAAEMLLGGTTCFCDMYFFPDEVAAVAVEAGLRAVVGMIVIEFPSAWAGSVDEYFRKGEEVHDRYRAHPLVSTAFAPHAPYTVGDEALRRIVTLAEELDVPVSIHLHETADEVEHGVERHGVRPLRRLEALGLLSPRLLAVHATQLEPEEIEVLALTGGNVVHCPESNLKLASGFCPVAALRDAGVNVACGTDGAASNNDLDMLSELRTASLLAKGVAGDPCALPAHDALEMATLAGARALGLDERTGSLRPGKLADLVAVDLGGLRARPVYDPVSQLVYATHRDQVRHVWVGGRQVVAGGRLTTLDSAAVLRAADAWREPVSAAQRPPRGEPARSDDPSG